MNLLFEAMAWVLALFYDIVPSYGVAIILLTLLVMGVTTPLTLKGTRSMAAMQALAPQMKEIQEKYKDDKEKQNEKLLEFYNENNINPLSGCLPLMIQMPVFIVLYRVLEGLTLPASSIGVQLGWTGGQLGVGQVLTKVPGAVNELPFQPAYLSPSSSMYQDLFGSYTMPFLGLDLAESAAQALQGGIGEAFGYLALVLAVGLTGWYQQWMTTRTTGANASSQQKMIGNIMILVLPLISFSLPAGVVLYFLVSNIYRVGVQAYTGHWQGAPSA